MITVGVALMIAGTVLFARAGLTAQPFGWVAYAPLTDTQFSSETPGRLVLMRSGNWWGLALTCVGALAVSSALGYTLGRRHRRSARND